MIALQVEGVSTAIRQLVDGLIIFRTRNRRDNLNAAIRNHPVEVIGRELRGYMSDMEAIASDDASVAARAAGLEWTGGSNQD